MAEAAKGPSEELAVCHKHNEPLKLFCKVEEEPICVTCYDSKEHKEHKVIPMSEAFEEYKVMVSHELEKKYSERILAQQEVLNKKREELLVMVSHELEAGKKYSERMLAQQEVLNKKREELLKFAESEEQETLQNFQEMHRILEEQEKSHLARIAEVKQKIASRSDEQLARLCRDRSSLQQINNTMEQMLQEPPATFLENARTMMKRSQKIRNSQNPLPFLSKMKERLSKITAFNPFVEQAMRQLKDALVLREASSADLCFEDHLKANIILDPDTAECRLILSEDGKSVRRGVQEQVLPDNPKRFCSWGCVLGCDGFTEGRHFWDVTVGSRGNWAVGVARESVERKEAFCISPEAGFWVVGKLQEEYQAYTPPPSSPLPLIWEPHRVRVALNYEEGQVSFSDTDTGIELYTYAGASFSGETLFPFFYLYGPDAHLSVP